MSGGGGLDALDGGSDTDSVNYSLDSEDKDGFGAGVGFRIDLALGRTTKVDDASILDDTLTSIENVVGSDARDVIIGSENVDNVLAGAAGNDSISGGSGNDVLSGGDGIDTLDGGVGTDTVNYLQDATDSATPVDVNLSNGTSQSRISGHVIDHLSGIENVISGSGNDALTGDGFANFLSSGGGADYLNGGAGNDTLAGGEGNDQILGGAGTDLVSFSDATTAVVLNLANGQASGGSGSDTIQDVENALGSKFDDSLTGSDGANLLYGQDGNDSLAGGKGNDILGGGRGNNRIDGGEGVDTLTIRDKDGTNAQGQALRYYVDLTSGTAGTIIGAGGVASTQDYTAAVQSGKFSVAADQISNVENVGGNYTDDFIRGNAAENLLQGWRGNDTVVGGFGDDILSGGSGMDVLDGGAGRDTVAYNVDTDERFGFTGTVGYDINLATGIADRLGGAGTDLSGRDTLISIENVNGTDVNDKITGSDVANVLIGQAGNDTILGGGGNDTLSGGLGINTLDGGEGDDLVSYGIDDDDRASTGLDINLAAGTTRGEQCRPGTGRHACVDRECGRHDRGRPDHRFGGRQPPVRRRRRRQALWRCGSRLSGRRCGAATRSMGASRLTAARAAIR